MATKTKNIVYSNIERSDWVFPEQIVLPTYEFWGVVNFMYPFIWTASCRRSVVAEESAETFLKSMHLKFNCEHGATVTQLHWTIHVVRARNEWVPTILSDALRLNVDYSEQGNGNSPLLNQDKFVVYKTWQFNILNGATDPESLKTRSHTFNLRQRIQAAPINTSSAQQLWRQMDDDAFTFVDRLYMIWYVNSPGGISYSPNSPRLNISARFTCANL